jgi:hypothetical protein
MMHKSIGQLVLVAAPSCCGKTLFLSQLLDGALPEVASAIGVTNGEEWRVSDAMHWARLKDEKIDRLIVAYAIPTYAVVSADPQKPHVDPRLEIVSSAAQTTFVTLVASSTSLTARLKQRYRMRLRQILLRPRGFIRRHQFVQRLLPIYRDPQKMRIVYEWWFRYVDSTPNLGSWVVDADAKYERRGWFNRRVSAPQRGTWITNVRAKYGLHAGTSWSDVLTRLDFSAAPGLDRIR